VRLDLAPGADLRAELVARKAAATARAPWTALAERLPRRLARAPGARAARRARRSPVRRARPARAGEGVQRFRFQPAEDAGYDKAEVTLGGVDTDELSSRTWRAARAGLFFIGEVVDVTGWLGRLPTSVGLGLGPRGRRGGW
jgi:predicted flavoprotein YhiN